jgi:uncharacterized membrane protein YesL
MNSGWRDSLDVWASPIMANLLWVLLCLPIITMPLAIIGLFAYMYHWMDDRRTQVFSIFFGTLRRAWFRAYLLFILDLLIGGFLVFNLLIFAQMDLHNPIALMSLGATLLCVVIFLVVNIPAWVLVAIRDVPLKENLIFAIRLVFAEPFWAVGIALTFALVFVLSITMPAAIFVSVTGAIAGYIASKGTNHMSRKYLSREDFQLFDVT